MNAQPARRGQLGCGIALLVVAALLAARLVWRAAGPGATTPAVPATLETADVARPPDGKALPTPDPAAFPPLPPTLEQEPPPAAAEASLERFYTTAIPAADVWATAEELGGVELGEPLVPPAPPARVGDRATFATTDGPREAELVYQDDLAAYWVESGLALDRVALIAAAGRLRDQYYPLLSATFGQEWRPGIDGDPRLIVLHVLGPPDAVELGYFNEEDEYPRALFSGSNEREMVYLNMSRLALGTPLYDGTLVHEVQHLIGWNLDANDDTWLNEGLAQLAETMAGLDTLAPAAYLAQPAVRLDRWNDAPPDVYAHYAASYLYLLYLWEQAGDAALRELARHPANGLAAVRAVLAGHLPGRTLEQFTGDWAAAVYLDGRPADPRYNLAHADALGRPFLSAQVRPLPFEMTATLDQFAVDTIALSFSGPAVISFAGDTTAALIDAPGTPEPFWFAPPANSSRAQLTAEVDLTGVSAATLDFAVWHDLEPAYDFAYLSASADGGRTWRVLAPGRPVAGSYGLAWGGSGGWVEESIALDAFAGQTLLLRFDVVTDSKTTGRGVALAGLALSTGARPVWRPEGFVLTGRVLPQRWEVRVIVEGETAQVIPLELDERNRGQAAVTLGAPGGALVITPLTPFAAGPADYWLRVTR